MFQSLLFLILSGFGLCAMSIIRKIYYKKTNESITSSLFFVFLYSAIIIAFAILILLCINKISNFKTIDGFVVLISAILGITISVTTLITIIGADYGSLPILIMSAMLGQIVISALYGIISNPEENKLTIQVVFGLIISIIIILLNIPFKKEGKNKKTLVFIILCVVVFFTNGIALTLYKIKTTYRHDFNDIGFIACYSLFTLFFTGVMMLVPLIKNKDRFCSDVKSINWMNILLICAYSLGFILSEYFSLMATSILPIIIQAPLSFSIGLILVTIFDCIIFKERLKLKTIVQLLLAVVCSVLFVI